MWQLAIFFESYTFAEIDIIQKIEYGSFGNYQTPA